jgi:flagellar protein FlgJ
MISQTDTSNSLSGANGTAGGLNKFSNLSDKAAFDSKGMAELAQGAHVSDPAAIKQVATQFEGVFINMMLKSMREATPQDGPLDSEQSKMFTSMLDQQMSVTMAKRGTGLADALIRQLSAQSAGADSLDGVTLSPSSSSLPAAVAAFKKAQAAAAAALPAVTGDKGGRPGAGIPTLQQAPHVRAFQEKLGAHADAASRETGIPAKFMLGQAALETGWGKREIKGSDGTPSHNLFGIKAGADWHGKTITAVTTEYVNGRPTTRSEKFRAYDSYADSFKDYANTLSSNKRYEKVIASAGDASSFAQGLQRAGYATDPNYAAKLTRIIKHSLAG